MNRNHNIESRVFQGATISSAAVFLGAVVLLLMVMSLSPVAGAVESSADIDKRVQDAREELSRLKDESAAMAQQIAAHDAAMDKSRQDMADANSRVRAAEESYNRILAVYEGRIIALYKKGEHQYYDIIIGSQGFNDALTRVSYLGKITDNDQKLILQVKAEERALRAAREDIDRLKQTNIDSLDSLMAKKAGLDAKIASLQQGLDADVIKLEAMRAIEQEAAAQRLAEEAASISIWGSPSGPTQVQNYPPPGIQPTGTVIHGVTSWYGPGFDGNRTANGETYDMYAFTAAHKTLPFNTWLKVNYNGRSVFVRINDRGPYIGGRFLDLSKGSAQALGITGIAYVSAEVYR
ncbi:MAG: septal ring lytic transglycosylase RlpA family protein [Thermoleophilia bacterium]